VAVLNFSGFFYIENDPAGPIDNSFPFGKDISNNPSAQPRVTYEDILAKFASPIVISRQTSLVNQKFIVDNYAYTNTIDDLDNIDTSTDNWDKLFNIANYIYHKAGSKTAIEINNVLAGLTVDDGYLTSLFTGYKPGSVDLTMRVDAPNLPSKFSFQVATGDGLQYRLVTMWVNPETFVSEFVTATPYIYVYYTPDESIERQEQAAEINKIFNHIGREYVNQYRTISVPLWTPDGELQPFHIFAKAITIPQDPLNNLTFLTVIRNTIRDREPTLSDEELLQKYPTIFTEGFRVIWPLFDNRTLGNYQVPDPLTSLPVYYLSNPVQLDTINQEINSSPALQGENGEYEIFTVAHKWYPFIAFGIGGALSDKIPKYRPLLDDILDANVEDTTARTFNIFITKTVNYIVGDTTISQDERIAMGLVETTQYVSFKLRGVEWRVFKRGYQTDFDTQPQ
jgi:hypothetical protein